MQTSPIAIKFCGLKRESEIDCAIELAIDYIGFVAVRQSPRFVDLETFARLVRHWRGKNVTKPRPVILVVNPTQALISEYCVICPEAIIQFHGDESPQQCSELAKNSEYWRAIGVKSSGNIEEQADAYVGASAMLIDAPQSGLHGGNGIAFDWSLWPKDAVRHVPWFLAGGLNPQNVAEAIAATHPDGVDVSSGIEESRGIKSLTQMVKFVECVRKH